MKSLENDKYRALFENTSLTIFIHDKDTGEILDANKKALINYGFSDVKDLRENSFWLEPPYSFKEARGWVRKASQEGPQRFEWLNAKKSGELFWEDVWLNKVSIGGVERVIGVAFDITQKKKLQDELLIKEQAMDSSINAIALADLQGKISYVNRAFIDLWGYNSQEDVIGLSFLELYGDKEKAGEFIDTISNNGSFSGGIDILCADEEKKYVYFTATLVYGENEKAHSIMASFLDMTERKEKEKYRKLGGIILGILNESGEFSGSVHRIIRLIKEATGCDAAGIRLIKDDDYPYYYQNGFTEDFLCKENLIAARDGGGTICRNPDGSISLECVCGMVISGNNIIDSSLFTPGGSFWTNNSFLLDLPELDEPEYRVRKYCMYQGYASIALIPVRKKREIVGLLQLNARAKDRFTIDTISYLEGIASHIGEAILRKQAEDEIKNLYYQLDEEVRKAEKVHRRVLPYVIPQTDNISIAAYNQPATRMGADSYNVIRSGDKLVIYLADVMGHGMDGAMINVFLKEAIDSYIVLKPDDLAPQKILNHLRQQYLRSTFPDKQMIAIYLAVLDVNSYEFIYSCAGFQTAPMLKTADGKRERPDTSGLFISNNIPGELLVFEERSLVLDTGSTMLISTDGLPEQDNGKEMFHKVYEDIFYENSHLPPEMIIQKINKEFCEFNNKSLVGNDDITYLVLQITNNKRKRFSMEINSNFEELDSLYKKISGLTAGLREEANILTCLHELVVNAIEHGNRFDKGKKVAIHLTMADDYLLFEIEDEGKGFNWCEKLEKPISMDRFDYRGRGIAMTKLMSGNLYYNYKGNKVTLILPVSEE